MHELVDPDGVAYVMQAYCIGVDPTLTEESLAALGERLALPEGWAYRSRVLDEELVVDTTTTWPPWCRTSSRTPTRCRSEPSRP